VVVGDFFNVATAEIFCCFMLYGSAVSTKDKKRHNNRLVTKLGLNVHTFENSGETNENFGPRRPVNCTLGRGNVTIMNGRMVFVGTPDSLVLEQLPRSLTVSIPFARFRKQIVELSNHQQSYKIFIECFIFSSLKVYSSQSSNLRSTCRFSTFYSVNEVVHVEQFIKVVAASDTLKMAGHGLLAGLQEIVRSSLQEDQIACFYQGFVKYLNNSLNDQCSPFCFPLPQRRKTLIVIPSYGFSTQQSGISLFVTAFNLRFPKHNLHQKIVVSQIHKLMNVIMYLPNAFWFEFKKIDELFLQLYNTCEHNTTFTSDSIFKILGI